MGRRLLGGLRCRAAGHVTWVLLGIVSIAAFYQLLALIAALVHRRHSISRGASPRPAGVSILKPVYGRDPGFYPAIRSHAIQQYPEFELLFGVHSLDDPASADIQRLIAEFPALPIRLIVCSSETPNRKVGILADLASEARYPLLIVNDSDITVPAGYLQDVTAPLSDSTIGLVTCLYRAEAHYWPSRFEALAVATDFAPSTMIAPWFGVSEFGLGSTLAFRRADLERIGGFWAIADYLADDYQLGRRLHSIGLRNVISHVVVSTRLSAESWKSAWRHQLRWARTIRLSRGGGYAGLPVTFATLWALLAALSGLWPAAIGLMVVRFAMALACGALVLDSADVWRYFYLIPVRDLWGVAVWAVALFGNTVEWRGRRLRLDREGKIVA
jgi:ceramide glucosyltransferase